MIRRLSNSSYTNVVITGLGIVAPNGIGKGPFWESLKKGESGIGPITLFDASDLPSRIAGEVKDFDPHAYVPTRMKPGHLARQTQLAIAATKLALDDAEIDLENSGTEQNPVPIILGVGYSAGEIIDKQHAVMGTRGPDKVSRHTVDVTTPHGLSGKVAEFVGGNTKAITISTACVGSLDATWFGADMIRSGSADVALVGGADSHLSRFFMAILTSAGISSCCNESPETASRPFDKGRDTGVIAEGGCVLILENEEHARARGATVYASITSYGTHTDPDPKTPASGLEQSMRIALHNGQLSPGDIDYICAHGPGHPVLDVIETQMIKKVFGDLAYRVPISSIKGVLGNPLGTAGAFQVAACALALKDKMIPPTANLDNPDPECDLDYVPLTARATDLQCVLINCHGVGGGNSSLLLESVTA